MSSSIGLGVGSVVVTPDADSWNSFQPRTIVGMVGDKSRVIPNSQTRGACIEEGVFVVSRSQFGGRFALLREYTSFPMVSCRCTVDSQQEMLSFD